MSMALLISCDMLYDSWLGSFQMAAEGMCMSRRSCSIRLVGYVQMASMVT